MPNAYNTTEELIQSIDPELREDFKRRNPELFDHAEKVKKNLKYRNIPTEANGILFQSGREAAAYGKFMLGLRSGEYVFVLRQVPFILQEAPEQIVYIADFIVGNKDRTFRVFDAKGVKTPMFSVKSRMFKKKYGFDIELI